MSDESGLVIKETWTLEKFRPGEDEPYEVVTVHADGSQSVWRREDGWTIWP